MNDAIPSEILARYSIYKLSAVIKVLLNEKYVTVPKFIKLPSLSINFETSHDYRNDEICNIC